MRISDVASDASGNHILGCQDFQCPDTLRLKHVAKKVVTTRQDDDSDTDWEQQEPQRSLQKRVSEP